MRTLTRVVLAYSSVIVVSGAAVAKAAEPRGVKVHVVETDQVDPATVKAVVEGIEDAARRVAERACSNGACPQVRTRIEQVGPDQHIELAIVDAAGSASARVEQTCDMCGLEELSTVAADLFARGWRAATMAEASKLGTLRVIGQPRGAMVEIDGEPAGLLPLDTELAGGVHAVTVRRPGYFQRTQSVQIVPGETAEAAMDLLAIPPDLERRHRRLQIGGLVTVGGGLVLGGLGAALFVADGREYRGRCSGADVDADGDCRQRWDSTAGAIAVTTAGVAALVTGAVLVGVGTRRRRAMEPQARTQWGPGTLRVAF